MLKSVSWSSRSRKNSLQCPVVYTAAVVPYGFVLITPTGGQRLTNLLIQHCVSSLGGFQFFFLAKKKKKKKSPLACWESGHVSYYKAVGWVSRWQVNAQQLDRSASKNTRVELQHPGTAAGAAGGDGDGGNGAIKARLGAEQRAEETKRGWEIRGEEWMIILP